MRYRLRLLIPLLFFVLLVNNAFAQNCTVNAGIAQTICPGSDFILTGSASSNFAFKSDPKWTQISGPAVTLSSTTNSNKSATAKVTNYVKGVSYTFRLSSQCQDGSTVFNDVVYTVSDLSTANAGKDESLCPGIFSLKGSVLVPGETGRWTKIAGDPNMPEPVNPGNPGATLQLAPSAGLQAATYRWTVTKGDCTSFDDVTITNLGTQPVSAGNDQNLSCYHVSTKTNLNGSYAAKTTAQSGTWLFVSGPSIPVIDNKNQFNTQVSNLIEGKYIFRWTVSSPCYNGSDEVVINVAKATQEITSANGSDQLFCDGRTAVVLNGTIPSYAGELVTWEYLSGGNGSPTFSNKNSSVTTVSGLDNSPGTVYRFKYTISNPATSCTSDGIHVVQFKTAPTITITTTPKPYFAACGEDAVTINYFSAGGTKTEFALVSAPTGSAIEIKLGGINNYTQAIESGKLLEGFNKIGTYILRYRRATENNVGGCSDAYADIKIVISGDASASNAGTRQVLACDVKNATLTGAVPPKGTGKWSQVSGPNKAIFDNPLNSNAEITGLINGSYIFRWVISGGDGGCSNSQADVEVVVSENVKPVTVAGNPRTTCYDTPVTLTGNTPLENETALWTVYKNGLPATEVQLSNPTLANAKATGLLANTAYTFRWTITNSCNSDFSEVVISTTATAGVKQALAGTDQCFPAATNTFNLDGNVAGAGETGTWVLISGPNTPTFNANQFNARVTGALNGTYVFQWQLSNGDCVATTDQVNITISDPVTTSTAGANQNLCGNATLLQGNQPAIGKGLWTQTEGAGGAVIADPTAYNTEITGLTDGRYKFTWTISNGSCAAVSLAEVTINVSTPSSIAAAGPDQAVCNQTSTILAASPVTNGHGRWAAISGPNVPTFSDVSSPTSTVSNLIYGVYQLEWISSGGLFCEDSRDQMTLTVSKNAYAGGSKTLCNTNTITLVGNANSTGVWTVKSIPAAASTPTLQTTGSNGAIVTGLVPGVYTFTYTIAALNGCPATSDDATYTISAPPTIADAGVDQERCSPTTTIDPFQLTANQALSGTGKWTLENGPAGIFSDPLDRNSTFSPSTEGVYLLKWEISNGDCKESSSSSDYLKISVSFPPTIAKAGANQLSACSDNVLLQGNKPLIGFGTWTIVSIPSTAPQPVIDQPNNALSIVTGIVPGDYTFKWTITNGSCTPSSSTVNITVTSTPPKKAVANIDQFLCVPAGAGQASTTLSGNQPTGIETGLWEIISPTPTTATFTDATVYNTTINGLTVGSYTLRWTLTNGSCLSSDEMVINVLQESTPAVITSGNQTICLYEPLTLTANQVTIGIGTWSVENKPGGASEPVFEHVNDNITNVFGLLEGQYTFKFSTANGQCNQSEATVTITVTKLLSTAIAGLDQTTCFNSPVTLNGNGLASGETGTWTVTSGQPATDYEFSNPNSPTSTFKGKAEGLFSLTWTINNIACATSSTLNITVQPELINNSISSTVTSVCEGGKPLLKGSTPTGGAGGYTYQWQLLVNGVFNDIAGATGIDYTPTLSNTSTISVTNTYNRVVRSGNCAVLNSNSLSITIPPTIKGNTLSTPITTFCFTGDPTVIKGGITTGGNGTYTYQWQRSLNSTTAYTNIPGATSADYDPDILPDNLTNANQVYRYKRIVTSGDCTSETTLTITVYPKPALTSLTNTSVCSNTLFSYTPTSAVAGSTFIWTRAKVNGIVNEAATGAAAISETLVNTTEAPVTVKYSYTISANGCENPTKFIVDVIVNPSPIGTNETIKTLTCGNSVFNYRLQDNIDKTYAIPAAFTWTVAANANVTGQSASSGDVINQNLKNNTSVVQEVIYTISPTSKVPGACVGKSFTLTVTVPVCEGITIDKTTTKITPVTKAGDQIPYTIVIKNTSNANQTNVVVTDPFLSPLPLTSPVKTGGNTDNILNTGETWTYSGIYIVSQSDIDNNGKPAFNSGKIVNTATLTSDQQKAPLTGSTTVNINAVSSYTIIKSSATTAITKAGQIVPYEIEVKNTGNTSISNVMVNDPMLTNIRLFSGDSNSNQKLDLGETWIFTGSHTITQTELDNNGNLLPAGNGILRNTVSVTGQKPDGTSVYPVPPTAEKNIPIVSAGSFTVNKSSTTTLITKAGQIVPFSITIANTGNVAISNVVVTDPMLSNLSLYSGDIAPANLKLDVNETWTYTGNYTVTQADLDNNGKPVRLSGNLLNNATVSGAYPNGTPETKTSNDVIIPIQPFVAYTIEKTADKAEIKTAGEPVIYTIKVKNTGDAAINSIQVADPMLVLTGPIGDGGISNILDKGETWTYTGTYTVTQNDIDRNGNNPIHIGTLSNTATLTGKKPDGTLTDPISSAKLIPINTSSSFTVIKTADKAIITAAGENVTYTITVKNTGSTAVSNVVITDPMLTLSAPSGDAGAPNILDVNETWIYKGTYIVSQGNIDNQGNLCPDGHLSNTVNVTGKKPDGSSAGSVTDILEIPILPAASFSLTKTSNVTEVSKVGDLITYTVSARNTGVVAIHSLVINDPMVNLIYQNGDTNTDGKLDLAEIWTYTGTYTVTQTDIDRHGNLITIGKMVNTVTGNGRKPDGTLLADVSATNQVDLKSKAQMSVVKASTATAITKAGEVVPYTITVTNTGTVAISDVKVIDPLLSAAPPILQSGDFNANNKLDVNETWTYTASYTVTQNDIDQHINSGFLLNIATVEGTSPNGALSPVTSNEVKTPIIAKAAYTIEKSSTTTSIKAAGEEITYFITVKNTGDAAIGNVVVKDAMFGPTALLPISGDGNANGKLDLLETWNYSFKYLVSQSDIDKNGNTATQGVLSNTATLNGNHPNGTALAQSSSTKIIPLTTTSMFTLDKTADKASVSKAGEIVNYTITLTNTGTEAISQLKVEDQLLSQSPLILTSGDLLNPGILDVSEVWVYNGTYTLTQADIDGKRNLINVVTATGTKPDGSNAGIVTSTNVVPIQPVTSFTLTKSSNVNKVTKAGDPVIYSVVVQNTGTSAINSVVINDPMVNLRYLSGDLNTDGKLDVTESWTYTGTYTVTQADIDQHGNGIIAGKLVNSATASGRKPDGSSIPPVNASTSLDIIPAPAMTVKKASATKLITAPGQLVTYAITVANTGTVAIADVQVNDPMLTGTSLYSGDVNGNGIMDVRETWTFTGTYTVTQADIDGFGKPVLNSGNLVNTASASGKLPNNDPINGTSNTVTIPIEVIAAYSVEKNSSTTEINVSGQTVPYTVVVTNTGKAAINQVVLVDPMLPLTLISGDLNNNQKLDVNEIWTFKGTYAVKQSDIDNNGNTAVKGVLSNTVTLNGKSPNGVSLAPITSSKVIPLNTSNLFSVIKTADQTQITKAGDIVNYTISVTNTGAASLRKVKVNDPLLGGLIASPATGDLINPGILDVGEVWNFKGSYTVTQADIDRNGKVSGSTVLSSNGKLINIVQVSAEKPDGNPAGTITAIHELPINPSATFTLTKTSNVNKVSKAGDPVIYTVVAKNTGLSAINTFVVTDPMVNLIYQSGDTNNDGKLNVTESWTYTGTYHVTQADLDNYGNGITVGKLVNVASAIGRKPDGTLTSTVNAIANVDIIAGSNMTIVKTSSTTVVNKAGQLIPYLIAVANTGTSTISDVIVSDPMLADLIMIHGDNNSNNKLDVNETWTYTGSYLVTQADLDNNGNTIIRGKLSNTATVTGIKPDDTSTGTISSTKEIPVLQKTDLNYTKVVTGQVGYIAGQTVTYELKVTNTGNTTLTNIVLSDNNAVITNGSPIATLSPGQTALATAVHTLTQADVDAGKVINQANLTAKDPNGNQLTAKTDDPSTPTLGDPTIAQIVSPGSITLVKTAILSGDGNTITYNFTVKNAGIVTLNNIVISDTKIAGIILVSPSILAPGQTGLATATYTITSIEKTTGQVSNTAIVTGTSPNGFKVNDVSGTNADNNTPTLVKLPKITGKKMVTDANGNQIIEAGETLTYQIQISNDGEVDRTNVSVSDLIPVNTNYVAGTADHGGIVNGNMITWNNLTVPAKSNLILSLKLTAASELPLGLTKITNIASIVDPSLPTTPVIVETSLPVEGKLESKKIVTDIKGNNDGMAQANEILTYTIEVKNSGGSTLTGINISDAIPAGLKFINASASHSGVFKEASNTLEWLVDIASGAIVKLSFDAHVVSDVNTLSSIKNIAKILSPNGQTLNPETTISIDPSADLSIRKEMLTTGPVKTGDHVVYKITVTNNGQNRATGVKVTDVLPGTLDAPFELVMSKGTSNYINTSKTLNWSIGDLSLNEQISLTFKARVVATGTLVNTATVTADQLDPKPDNNSAASGGLEIGGEDLFIPNLFTPNGDGRNDAFEIRGLDQFPENELVIVNRWGNEVFRTTNYQNNWTGEGLNEGTYYYLLKARKTGSGEWKVFKGYVTLIQNFKK